MIKKLIVIFLIFMFTGCALGADIIVDELPELPQSLRNSTEESIFTPNEFDVVPASKYSPSINTQQNQTNQNSSQQQSVKSTAIQQIPATTSYETIKINKGAKFKVINTQQLSDTMKKGTKIYFVTTVAETNRYITIPQGTVFIGKVVDAHRPDLTGNGGLLVIKVTHMQYKTATYPINAKITIANQKKVFFNNIKGKRKYWKNLAASTQGGKKTYDKMWKLTKKYFKPSLTIIITPFTFVSGVVVYGANIAISPILAIFTKGENLRIPEKSKFEIKFLEDGIIYK